MMNEQEHARLIAAGERSEYDKKQAIKRSTVRHELTSIEQLADRIGILCAAQIRLTEVGAGSGYDLDAMRSIRLSVASMNEALANVEHLCYEIDMEESGRAEHITGFKFSVKYEDGLAGVEGMANDIGVQVNAESFTLGLIASRKRPSPRVVGFVRYVVNLMSAAVQ